MKPLLAALLVCLSPLALAGDPQVRVEQRLVPDTPVLVGATVSLEVDLLVDTWFTDAPVLPTLELPDAVVGPPGGEAQHLNQDIAGKRFFGLRYRYQIIPQVARRFEIPALAFKVTPGQGSGALMVSSQPLAFQARGGAGNAGEAQPVARTLTLTQDIQRSHTPLRAGDSITRRLRIEAPGAQAMLLQAPELAEVEGLKRYVQAPRVKPLSDGRGGTLGGEREDTVSYVIGAAGHYRLPAIVYSWRDAASGEVHQVRVPAVDFDAGALSYQAPFSISEDLRALGHQARIRVGERWLLLGGCLLAFAALAWLVRAKLVALWRQFQRWRARRQQAWHDSPAYAWKLARRQCGQQPARLDALYLWARRSSGRYTLASVRTQLSGAAENRLLAFFKSRYGNDPAPGLVTITLQRLPPPGQRRQMVAAHHGLKPLNP
ncbi:hypothetical protein [Pseudomonas rubra]|uniref:Oxygen tolerance n=1 Tax=Pseudomonas rubra TaxID=2942627 RepID=A0ABT5P6I1_9PSED|nr:hypothetical protein [Pseudomonas rubra]MDD1013899.1 hypothetical protein [Pseudomonas rubra]MDD1038280.1 hypothetical protein [Pseudomonas rubra]MDD1154630.1 hypothetical protein [Pseudomonas rubra]